MRKKVGLRWTERAIDDLVDIGAFIARDNPAAARAWVANLRQRARDAASMPLAGRRVLEVEQGNVREVLFRGYRIIYRVDAKAILVLRVLEGHRQVPHILDEEE